MGRKPGKQTGHTFLGEKLQKCQKYLYDNIIKLFNYTIIRGTLRTNKIATHHVNTGPNCSHCQKTVETILHLFLDCPITKQFINEESARMDIIYPNHNQQR